MTVQTITYTITVHLIGGGTITVSNILRAPKLKPSWRGRAFTATNKTTREVTIVPWTSIKTMVVTPVVGR